MSRIIVKQLEKGTYTVVVGSDSVEEQIIVLYGSASVEQEVVVKVVKPEARITILGLFIISTGSTSLKTIQHHTAPHTMSDLHIKSILTGNASFNYQGMIKIDKEAQQSNAYQQNDNLLLSPKAHVDTKPELEIIANDVKCSHGATIGRFDDDVLYYMQSRGLPKEEAYQLALNGFAQDIIINIPDEQIRCDLNQYVKEELQKLGNQY